MALPPAWKVKRELWRVYEKAKNAVSPRLLDHLRQRHHDRNLHRLLRETPGARPLTARVAVFVLFQPKGIAGSTFLTLHHLAQEGWSALVISNAPLSDADRTRLAAASGHVIERPNTGYDFGAYREGWRWLHRHAHALDRLILMNDSTWFPLRMNDDSLRRMEALDADLAGHIFKTENEADARQDHVEAHLLMIGPRAVDHQVLHRFWDEYIMSSSKDYTIERGEKGITQAFRNAQLSVSALLDKEKLIAILDNMTDDDLMFVLENVALHTDVGRQQRETWRMAALCGQPWRKSFLDWTSYVLSNSLQHLLSVTFIHPAVQFGGMGFLKKSNDPRFQLARMALLRGINKGDLAPVHPVVANEVDSAILNWIAPHDWRADPNKQKRPLEL